LHFVLEPAFFFAISLFFVFLLIHVSVMQEASKVPGNTPEQNLLPKSLQASQQAPIPVGDITPKAILVGSAVLYSIYFCGSFFVLFFLVDS
jgi:hypothetical protein